MGAEARRPVVALTGSLTWLHSQHAGCGMAGQSKRRGFVVFSIVGIIVSSRSSIAVAEAVSVAEGVGVVPSCSSSGIWNRLIYMAFNRSKPTVVWQYKANGLGFVVFSKFGIVSSSSIVVAEAVSAVVVVVVVLGIGV